MTKNKSDNREKAFEIYKNANGNITPKKIAEELGENPANIRTWKSIDKWDIVLGFKRNKPGAPKGNKNSVGNKGGAPEGNLNAIVNGNCYDPTKHMKKDFLRKYLPKATQKILKETSGISLLDILWSSIQLQLAAVIRNQQIMHVENKEEMIKELKKTKVAKEKVKNAKTKEIEFVETYREEEYEFEFAWNRQATFLNTQSKAYDTLIKLIKQYDEMLHANIDLATEEQKLRIELLKTKLGNGSNGIDNVQIVDDLDE